MKKFLLTGMVMSAIGMMAQTEANPPQTGFYISGINGVTQATESNTLTYVPGNEDDVEEGIYRYMNDDVIVEGETETITIVGFEGMEIGYDADNFMGMPNILSNMSNRLYLTENGEPINVELPSGSYKVILSSMTDFDDETRLTWMIQFTNNDSSEPIMSYYIIGLNDEEVPAQSNQFVSQVLLDEDTGEESTMYTYPKFYISGEGSFQIINNDSSEVYGGMTPVTESEGMGFAMLTADGDPVEVELSEGYYSINFAPMEGMAFLTFNRCEDQTPVDECTYYLSGFGDDIKFERIVEETSYEDEDTGEVIEESYVNYFIKNVHLSSCPDGFLINAEEGQLFSFGLYSAMAAMLGSTVTNENGMAMICINGDPIGWEMEENDYNVTFYVNGTAGYIAFELYDEDEDPDASVDSIGNEMNHTTVYFDLQGRKINNPDKGIFIKKTGNKTIKIVK